jgi:hypothetical protein
MHDSRWRQASEIDVAWNETAKLDADKVEVAQAD